jgi:signal transduction histidine kinase
MSAAILVEGGAEIAMVAILSDLRPQEELAARLSQAQERLEESERHKVAAEVAGAAAHELNQPLTSLLGLAELLQRAMGAENPLAPAAQSLMREAERVAVIVRKLGRVVKYESKPYVGTSQIVDLDRAGRGSGEEA